MSYLTSKNYEISGNSLQAFYDPAGKLIFILDKTLGDIKPNVLLVLDRVGNRKWDDILSNDYGVDLESVRPKKDNKYQKLDIEYSGLDKYEKLIKAFENGDDFKQALGDLIVTRDTFVRKTAAERLSVAESNSNKARDTILKTNETIKELQVRLKELRLKISKQKKDIGKEPTKQSASKILKTEAQIDSMNEKLGRAKKRLQNAQRRLFIADEDAENARNILSRGSVVADSLKELKNEAFSLPVKQTLNEVAIKKVAPVPALSDKETDLEQDIDITIEQKKAEPMAEDDIKPLFDEDPEILDEEIAFKPINFGDVEISKAKQEEDQKDVRKDDHYETAEPLSFVPPIPKDVGDDNDASIDIRPITENTTPVLDTIKSVDVPEIEEIEKHQENDIKETNENVMPIHNDMDNVVSESRKEQNISPAPVSSDFRPVSPITGNADSVTPITRKPTLVYYIMLVVLIVLSIFTLWLYQKNTSKENLPDIAAKAPVVDEVVDENKDTKSASVIGGISDTNNPFIQEEVTVDDAEDDNKVINEMLEEEKVNDTESVFVPDEISATNDKDKSLVNNVNDTLSQQDVFVEVEDISDQEEINDIIEETSNVSVKSVVKQDVKPDVIDAPTVLVEEIKPSLTEEEIIANKPAYNVSQNEKMFVADPEYEADFYQNEISSDDNIFCPDGTSPDINGCCTGEVYTNLGEAGFNCCPIDGGDCFPPMF